MKAKKLPILRKGKENNNKKNRSWVWGQLMRNHWSSLSLSLPFVLPLHAVTVAVAVAIAVARPVVRFRLYYLYHKYKELSKPPRNQSELLYLLCVLTPHVLCIILQERIRKMESTHPPAFLKEVTDSHSSLSSPTSISPLLSRVAMATFDTGREQSLKEVWVRITLRRSQHSFWLVITWHLKTLNTFWWVKFDWH